MNTATAELVTEPVAVVPSSAALTLAIVAASTSNDARTSRIDCICETERPEAGIAGVAGTAGVADTAGVVVEAGTAGIAGVADTVAEPPPPLLVEPLPPLLVEEQSVEDGVMVTVTLVLGEYARSDWLALQTSLDTPVRVLAVSRFRFGAVT